MEQSTQTDRVKKKLDRPKGTGLFTEEGNKERARQRARLYYSLNLEIHKCLYYYIKYLLILIYLFIIHYINIT